MASLPPPLDPLKLGDLQCHTDEEFGWWHQDVHSGEQGTYAKVACEKDQVFTSATTPSLSTAPRVLDVVTRPYRYKNSWVEGCQTAESS